MSLVKKVARKSLIALMGASILLSVPTFTFASEKDNAQKLVDALEALNVGQVDYLYTYLQSNELTDSEYESIMANANRAVVKGVESRDDLTNAQKTEVLRLVNEEAQKHTYPSSLLMKTVILSIF